MSTVTAKFTLEHYEHMVETGVFDGPFRMRVELINGEITEMSPIGYQQANAINLLHAWSITSADASKVIVASQNPIRMPLSGSEPEPDVVWVNKKNYQNHPEPADVLLLIEVADSSLDYDRGEKSALYAEAGIKDYWIVNLIDSQIEGYRDPAGKAYQTKAIFGRNDAGPNPLASPGVTLAPSHLF